MSAEPKIYNHKLSTDQKGASTTVIVGTLAFLAITLAGLSGWALYKYNQERTTVEAQIEEAVTEAKEVQRQEDEERFEEERRNPYRTYTAPSIFGGIELEFPKNWNVYVEDDTSGREQIDLYMHPDLVRNQSGTVRPYAFRMQLNDRLYQDVVSNYDRGIEDGTINSTTVTVSGIEGVRLKGEITREHSGEMVILPFRDKTITMWTEGSNYREQFQEVIDRANISR